MIRAGGEPAVFRSETLKNAFLPARPFSSRGVFSDRSFGSMEKYPFSFCVPSLTVLAGCFAAGILLQSVFPAGPGCFIFLTPAAMAACLATLYRPKYFIFCAVGCVMILGMHAGSVRSLEARDNVARITQEIAGPCRLDGVVVSERFEGDRDGSFIVEARRISRGESFCRVSGRVRVRLKKSLRREDGPEGRPVVLMFADNVVCPGRFSALSSFDRRLVAGGDCDAVFLPQAPVKRCGWDGSLAIGRWAFAARQYFASLIRAYHSPEAARVMEGMLLGRKTALPAQLRQDAVRAGTWHIFVVSGSHVGLVAFIVAMVLKLLRLKGRVRLGLVVLLLWAYCFLTGASAPVLRATVMSCVFFLCLYLERNPLFLNALCIAGCVILLSDPRQLFSLSFQLSFLSVFSIFCLFPILDPRALLDRIVSPTTLPGRWGRGAAVAGAVSVCAWVGTAPLMACAFGNISWIGIAANMVIVPLSAVVMAAGFSFLCLSWCVPAAHYLAAADDGLVAVFLSINRYFARIEGGYASGLRVLPAVAAGIYLSLLFLVIVFKREKQR